MKHTPGPWNYNEGTRDVIVSKNGYNDVLIAQLYKIGSQHEANARLIAAAPELLEACKAALEVLILTTPKSDKATSHKCAAITLVTIAIAKAERK